MRTKSKEKKIMARFITEYIKHCKQSITRNMQIKAFS